MDKLKEETLNLVIETIFMFEDFVFIASIDQLLQGFICRFIGWEGGFREGLQPEVYSGLVFSPFVYKWRL